jgi:hypothetical protein
MNDMTEEQIVLVTAWMRREVHILQGQARDYAMRGEQDRVEACNRRIEAFSKAIEKVGT